MYYVINVSKCRPINETTYETLEAALAAISGATPISETRVKSMGEVFEAREGENPIILRRRAAATLPTRSRYVRNTAPLSAERQYDMTHNEGGEGYNPHRIGDVPTYWRGVR